MTKLNTLPKITWRWIKVNDTQVKLPDLEKKGFSLYEDRLVNSKDDKVFDSMKYGLSDEVLELNKEYRNWTNEIYLPEGEKLNDNYQIHFNGENDQLVDLQFIHLREGASATLIYDYSSEEDLEFIKNTLFKIKAEKYSHLKLVLVQKLSDKGINLTSMVSSIDESAKVELIAVDLGSKETHTNYVCDLFDVNSQSQIHSAYFVDGEREHDINFLINHRGESTISDLQVNGALKDHAKKRFAGTLDFKTGSKGSVGNEEEFVTLIDEEVKSIALPLLLASEHDIMGNHAASAGRIDQDILIYLMSRGLTEKEAKALAVEAKMTPTVDLIDDEEIRKEVKEFIHKGITG